MFLDQTRNYRVFIAVFCLSGDSAWIAQLAERVHGKDEVTGSIPVPGSKFWQIISTIRRIFKSGRW